jgi:superfamily II DNA helicase RecQ
MGMDFPNITFIVHWDAALSMQEFVQQIGRGGRNGNHCLCVTFYEPNHLKKAASRARKSASAQRRAKEEENIAQVWMLAQQHCLEE